MTYSLTDCPGKGGREIDLFFFFFLSFSNLKRDSQHSRIIDLISKN